ncbi:histidinol-phosphatase (PHP family) [Breznakia sp. PF5-3]|uniref:PHP domain-containing protein n=1 Tax=unclassified Breznakia TaxID=2623764 RepID=UPI00240637DA|nr:MULTISPECIES: PHP domain-containing protein [unclassified Breznakia]MDF9823723.1 histidinol-phosphatase (PHP family) [Breznakia sp. PM6-1]MDF9834521.1 histidinol-phosphatase (PHP family) [Breznakia sp. PF5-3]MDF9837508.1 histidinol-phosphatase (PHP family) [Breznakia sp. PFB2-8]MDF9859085.1 histidinol-phosphatase (PHP family) [Breznakia sp. PH5-24]
MIDGHMHLEYGPLTKEYVLEFVEAAKKKKLTKIQILDHTHRFIEFKPLYENLRNIEVQDSWLNSDKKFCNTLQEFIDLMEEIKSMNTGIQIDYGLEVCYVPEEETFLKKLLSQYTFDFLVGAIHSIDGILYDMNFSKKLLWEVQPVDVIYKRYYELIFKLIKSDLFTQLAHPDTIKLFNYYPTYDLTPTYETLATLLNEHHMKAENNTGCYYRYKHKDMGLSDELLQILKKHTVKMITASDAHQPDHVGSYITEIYEKTMK